MVLEAAFRLRCYTQGGMNPTKNGCMGEVRAHTLPCVASCSIDFDDLGEVNLLTV